MMTSTRSLSITLLTLSVLFAGAAFAAEEKLKKDPGEVPLEKSDKQEISALVLAANPELASSPGIKYSLAFESPGDGREAFVIFEPHADTGGVKKALQVDCLRASGESPWTCNPAKQRRYMRVENQEVEVVVVGDIDSREALAVVEATRTSLSHYLDGQPADSCRAIQLMPGVTGYKVNWSCEAIDTGLYMHATPIAGADTTRTSGWQTSEYVLPQQRPRQDSGS